MTFEESEIEQLSERIYKEVAPSFEAGATQDDILYLIEDVLRGGA